MPATSLDAVPNWQIRFILWRDRPYVVKSATHSTNAVATLPATARGLKRAADPLGLKPLRHPSQQHGRTHTVELVISTRGIALTCERITALGKYIAPSDDWIQHAISRGEAVLLMMAGDPTQFSSFDHLIDWLIGSQRGFSARIRVVNLRSADPRLKRYEFVDPTGTNHAKVPINSSIIVDADVLLDLQKAAAGRITDPEVFDSVADLYGTLRACDVIPGFAVAQLAWDRQHARVDTERRIELLAAMSTWANLPVAKYRSVASLKRRYDATRKSMQAQGGVYDNWMQDFRHDLFVLLGYAAMLKTATYWHGFEKQSFSPVSRVDAYIDLIDFVNQDALGASGYPFMLCRALLVGQEGPNNKARSFFKFSDGIAGIYGTTWDLYYLLMLDQGASGQLENTGSRPIYLLTADRRLKEFKRNSTLAGTIVMNDNPIGVVRYTVELSNRITPKQRRQIEIAEQRMYADASLRSLRSVHPNPERLLETVRSLENEVDQLFPARSKP